MVRGNYSHFLAPGLRKIVYDTWKERPIEGKSLVNMETSKRAFELDAQFAGFGTLRKKPEGAQIPFEDPVPGALKRYTWDTFALGFRITMEMMEDDLYGIAGKRLSKSLARSNRHNQEIVMHQPLNRAFDTAYTGFNSGESLVSTSHALIKGGTLSNRPATDTDLTLPGLQAAIEHFHQLTDEAGMPIVGTPRTLVVGINDWWIANQLLKSPQLPGGNQNDINQLQREGIRIHLSHYLTDPDAWFLMSDTHSIQYFDRKPFTFSNNDDPRTKDAEFMGLARRASHFSDWRGIYGSSGG